MNTGIKLALAVTALSVAACGPTDPSDKNSTANNVVANNTTTANNVVANNTTTANNVMANNTTTANNTTANNTTANNVMVGPCVVNDVFFGQIDANNDDHAGGAPSTDPIATDAGLAGALGMFTAMEEMPQTVDIAIAGAIVTATSFGDNGNANFWVQDSGAAMQVFLGFDNRIMDATVKVGDAVSFTITEFNNFSGHPQISAVTGFTIDSSGNGVPYADITGMAPTADQYNTIVRIGGTLSATGEACGGSSTCYDLMHDGQSITYRTSSEFIEGGECVTYFGPLSGFPGPNADSGNTPEWQLNVNNFSWSWERFDQ